MDNYVVYNVMDDDGRWFCFEKFIEFYNGLEMNENVIYNVEEVMNIVKIS